MSVTREADLHPDVTENVVLAPHGDAASAAKPVAARPLFTNQS
jgi:hypothetical protein